MWSPAYKYVLSESAQFNSTQLRKCLSKMLDEGLIRVIPAKGIPFEITTADWNTRVTLEPFGDQIKEENRGWLRFLESIKEKPSLISRLSHASNVIIAICTVGLLGLTWLSYTQTDKLNKVIEANRKLKSRIEADSTAILDLKYRLKNRKFEKPDSTTVTK